MQHKRPIIIVTAGRTGSTLLAASMARAGADFGMRAATNWDPRAGDMELPIFTEALGDYARADQIARGEAKPVLPLRRLLWSMYRRRARRKLEQALCAASAFKAVNSDLALNATARLGYAPRIILSYRRLEPFVSSSIVRGGYHTADSLIGQYDRSMRNGLTAVALFGGCVVSYDEIGDPAEIAWAGPVADLMEIERTALLDARAALLRNAMPDPSLPCLSAESQRLWREAEAIKHRVLTGMRASQRIVRHKTAA